MSMIEVLATLLIVLAIAALWLYSEASVRWHDKLIDANRSSLTELLRNVKLSEQKYNTMNYLLRVLGRAYNLAEKYGTDEEISELKELISEIKYDQKEEII